LFARFLEQNSQMLQMLVKKGNKILENKVKIQESVNYCKGIDP
jgi:hypothetical protein